MERWGFEPWQWQMYNGTNTSYTLTSATTTMPITGRIVLDDVPVAAPPPRTEVQRLLADVEAVCALAR